MENNEQKVSKDQQELSSVSAEGQQLIDEKPVDAVSDGNQDLLEEALDMVQGGVGGVRGGNLHPGVLKKEMRLAQGKTGWGLSALKRGIRPMHRGEDPDPDSMKCNDDDYGDGPITDDGPR
jgi:hypothetical protein